jgi:hypothetical protein
VNKLPRFGLKDQKLLTSNNGFAFNSDSANLVINQKLIGEMNKKLSYKTYLHNNEYNYYPLVNVNYTIADNFCKWRTQMVKIQYSLSATEKEREKFYDDILYRLPTYEEEVFALTKFNEEKNVKTKRSHTENFLIDFWANNLSQKFFITPLNEIVNNAGNAFSIQWNIEKQSMEVVKPITNIYYNTNMTFRCICEVK